MNTIAVAVAVITGLTQVIKKLGVRTKYIPLTAVLLGVIYAGFVAGWDSTSVINGIIAGLTSVGLYRTVQKTVDN